MIRALAYCAFCFRPEISLPPTGVTAADVRVVAEGELRLLWSEVEWPFASERMQKNALEFHDVISHVFRQAAVIPFRLLSVFEDEKSLAAFTAEHAKAFLADLERLKDCVQMECVVFPAPSRKQTNNSSGADYLREKAAMLREQGEHVKAIQEGLSGLAREIQVREGKNGTRIFVLTERGREKEFRSIVEQQAVPAELSRRISGPWPAAEFLSEQVRAPQVAGAK
ncbi:MAG TPA: GvpL/GvpF family gas vesicle protein [Candidatus Acidoferrales bacterium]|nr:GvpL/GvpF family gas vesicle protein [Candidatus Acidoferrales bacterium]